MTEPAPLWIEVEERIDASPEDVFPYFVEADRYIRWMGIEASLEPRPGGLYRVRMPNALVAVGEFVAVEPFTRIVFTWGWEGSDGVPPGSTTVEVTLREAEGGTIVRVRHSGLPDEQAATMHTEGWEKYLSRLAAAGSGGDPGDDLA